MDAKSAALSAVEQLCLGTVRELVVIGVMAGSMVPSLARRLEALVALGTNFCQMSEERVKGRGAKTVQYIRYL